MNSDGHPTFGRRGRRGAFDNNEQASGRSRGQRGADMNDTFDFDPSRTGRHPGGHPRNNDFDGGPRRGRGGPMRRGGPERRGGRGRATRGDVRAAILALLSEESMHGYQLMQAIAERSNGVWTPSPGAIYPVLSQLEDEALVTISIESGRKVATLTEDGRTAAAALAEAGHDPFRQGGRSDGPDLRLLVHSLSDAVRQVARTGTDAQREKAAALLTEARRNLYLLLAEAPDAPDSPQVP